jgi:hypothetical protein
VNKKIRYAIGAVGAVPALAMIPGQLAVPAAHAGTTAATGKKVRTIYATDTAMLAPASSRSSVSSAAISPDTGSCVASQGHHITQNGITVRFYARPVAGNRTCIGTIKVSDGADLALSIGGYVQNSHGIFCKFSTGNTVTTDRCRRVFANTNGFDTPQSLVVAGFSHSIFGYAHAYSVVPFKNKGF